MSASFLARVAEVFAIDDPEHAALAFMALYQEFPDDGRLAEEAGNRYFYGLGDPARAIPCWELALETAANASELHVKLAAANAALGDDATAAEWLARDAEPEPALSEKVAEALTDAGRHELAAHVRALLAARS